MKKFNCKRPQSGFTLVEVLMVVLIISVLAGMVLGIAGYANKKAAYSKAEAELQKLGMLFEEFRLEEGFYPNTYTSWTNVSAETFNNASTTERQAYYQKKLEDSAEVIFDNGVIVKVGLDPWLNDYEIKIPDRRGFLLRIRSLGEDGAGAEDDSDPQNNDNLELQ